MPYARRQFMTTAFSGLSTLIATQAVLAQVRQRIRIGSILAGTTVAGELLPKYLQSAGVDAEVVNFTNITQRMQAVASGDVEIGYGGINAAINIAARGVPIQVMANGCAGGYALVGRHDVTQLSQLKGKKIAVQFGSMQYALLQWLLKKNNLLKDVEQLNLNNPEMVIAMQRGDIDAMFSVEPYPSLTIAGGWGQSFGDAYSTPAGKTSLGLVASAKFVNQKPALARQVLEAHRQATASLSRDPSFAIDTLVKTLNMSRGVAELSMKNMEFTSTTDEEFRRGVMATGDLMLAAGLIDKLPAWDTFFYKGA